MQLIRFPDIKDILVSTANLDILNIRDPGNFPLTPLTPALPALQIKSQLL